MVILEII